ncbi:MAG: hypothetical protein IT208_00050 [Chthonomonadales bacterium]|nr:hypothetical protein [Chthonomonadales bacterium]
MRRRTAIAALAGVCVLALIAAVVMLLRAAPEQRSEPARTASLARAANAVLLRSGGDPARMTPAERELLGEATQKGLVASPLLRGPTMPGAPGGGPAGTLGGAPAANYSAPPGGNNLPPTQMPPPPNGPGVTD